MNRPIRFALNVLHPKTVLLVLLPLSFLLDLAFAARTGYFVAPGYQAFCYVAIYAAGCWVLYDCGQRRGRRGISYFPGDWVVLNPYVVLPAYLWESRRMRGMLFLAVGVLLYIVLSITWLWLLELVMSL